VPHALLRDSGFELPGSRRTIGDLLKHRPFSGLVHSAGELLHSLADFNFHDHGPAVYMHQRPSRDLISRCLGTIGPLSVHPASPILLTKNGPLGDSILVTTSLKDGSGRAPRPFRV